MDVFMLEFHIPAHDADGAIDGQLRNVGASIIAVYDPREFSER